MAIYQCATCQMAVDVQCATCHQPLADDMLKLEDGSEVRIAKCPTCAGKIKSPLCCGSDMACQTS